MIESSSRRRFLQVVATGGAAVGVACLAAACAPTGPTGTIQAGNVSDLGVPSLKAVPNESLAVGRDANGVYALSLICTHAACDMETQGSVSPEGIVCFCHGSQFTANGAVLSGPAGSPLEHYEVTISAQGAISVNADKTVDAATRVQPAG
jgi:cytochrome b6-f complex iron-sulfur subunit